jgi:hypothetical protein
MVRTTAWTAIQTFAQVTGQDPEADRNIVYGQFAGDYSPGDPVVLVAGVWTLATTGTAAHLLMKVGIVAHLGVHKDKNGVDYYIQTALDISAFVANSFPVHTGGKVVAKIIDPAGAIGAGRKMTLGVNALKIGVAADIDIDTGITLAEHAISTDVFAMVQITPFTVG